MQCCFIFFLLPLWIDHMDHNWKIWTLSLIFFYKFNKYFEIRWPISRKLWKSLHKLNTFYILVHFSKYGLNSFTVVALGEIFPLWGTWLAYICGGLELFLADLVHLPLILIIHIIPITHQNHFLLSPFFFILIINLPQLGLNPNSIIFRFTFSWVNFKLGLKLPDQRGQMSVFGNFSQTNLML